MLQAKLPRAEPHRLALLLLRAFEISNHQASICLEHTSDFSKSKTLEVIWQVVHHQGREHHIEWLIGKWELLDHSNPEVDGETGSPDFGASMGNLLETRVNAAHLA